MPQFFGKYRGTVANNLDPQLMGRIQVQVPAVLGEGSLSWAMPCAPYAGAGVGFFMIPPVGANVWVEFEGGDPDYPIWCGGFWGLGEAPDPLALPFIKIIKTDTLTLKLDDTPGIGGVTIETALGAKITLLATGIEITNGMGATIQMTGPQISLNNGALDVI